MKIVKNITDIANIYTYFEFEGYDGWDKFDNILAVLVNQMGCRVVEKIDGIYSRHYFLDKAGVLFQLMYHEDFGNCLCSKDKKDGTYYNILECIAKEAGDLIEPPILNEPIETKKKEDEIIWGVDGTPSKNIKVVESAMSKIGAPFGRGTDEFVGSKLVQLAYADAGINLPPTTAEQAEYCDNDSMRIKKEELIPGDLIFYADRFGDKVQYKGISRVSIYVGDNNIIDASLMSSKVEQRSISLNDKNIVFCARPLNSIAVPASSSASNVQSAPNHPQNPQSPESENRSKNARTAPDEKKRFHLNP